ncbi:hypothetical protein [Spirillospora albida]|nr:hypothetical protein [Spirillospora albida]
MTSAPRTSRSDQLPGTAMPARLTRLVHPARLAAVPSGLARIGDR